ncbi:glycine--tRNA ligase subunit beta [Nisaea acidiphila]|uniref:Glycine--tRNA ligase beta subunit n=1 Tax=Nisaea acidiphila TaxID=1862145 RepID=A0A9J7ASF0_9PROT|nr:glycine--tRNA ligase subunit beta [Nisaea acidiphila]UUX48253.1 glycine--tRNA ligase subunit beta [Nisaea acidiphila]
MSELLVELFSEEIPARMQKKAADDLLQLLTDKLKKAGLEGSSSAAYVTPRRLVAVIDGLPEKQPDTREERRGPKADAPEKALEGFLGSVGLTLEQCEKRETPKGTFLYAVVETKGAETISVLPGIVAEAVKDLAWPKSMRWGRHAFRWVRPMHGVLAVFGGETLKGAIDLGGGELSFTNETKGHRFLAPDAIAVTGFADYAAKLRDAYVIVDREERKSIIMEGATALAESEGLTLKPDQGLLEEVCGLVEWPVPVMGRIDDAFMDVPAEALVTSMRSHQKYFSAEKADGSLAARFITVSNMKADEKRDETIRAGNEKVLRARLSDAKFFWDQDRAAKLESRRAKLSDILFYQKLGTVADKVARMEKLSGWLSDHVPGADAAKAGRAAALCKADLVTEMVGEFPELQGIMGRYYALHDGEAPEVADAIADHYAPQGPNDRCPTAPESVVVALADKIDTLAGFFAIDEKPTGSKDPFALRRAALGVIRLIVENKLRLPLAQVFEQAARLYEGLGAPDGILDFFADRLKVHLREAGVRHDLVSAVFALGGEDDLVRLLARVEALQAVLSTDDGANLLAGVRRAGNIVKAEEKKDGTSYEGTPDDTLLDQAEEKTLSQSLVIAEEGADKALADENFEGAMAAIAGLRGPVDAFFDKVTVNVDDASVRKNRLALLARVGATANRIADFSRIEG